ncbi:MAG TPA: antitoxin Xre/MbcA/ParS toxin-binding domain-containing protein [Stellaceae bacterium]|jgi:uncharacterized protein (DUF2384 family)|nr:antitoxin Xre/MbcA/ParS toxin-binding domain-containing protein [Stellaceae bacterium]
MRSGKAEHLPILDASDTAREGTVLSKAVVRAAEFLEISDKALAKTLGLSAASISRMKRGTYVLSPDSKPFELGQLFVRLFRSLDAITGSDDAASRSWLQGRNTVLNGRPIDLIQSLTGLTAVLFYVDSRRAPL